MEISRIKTRSRGEQMARYSLYAPILGFVIGAVTRINQSQDRSVAIAILVINSLLVLSGFVFGIVALVSMRRFGRSGILVRSILGILFNGAVIALVAMTLIPLVSHGALRSRVVGHWQMQQGEHAIDIQLLDDGTFRFATPSIPGSAQLVGRWVLTRDKVIGLNIDAVAGGDQSAVGKKIGLGRIETVDDRTLILQTDNGKEMYNRRQ